MQDNDTNESSESTVKKLMGPTPEESPPVSVPNISAVDVPESGEVIEPALEAIEQTPEETEPENEPESKGQDDNTIELEGREEPEPVNEKSRSRMQKLKICIVQWWHNKPVRYATLVGVGILLVVLLSIPPSRYFILNDVGVRASASVTIHDQSTSQPLKNVQIRLSNQVGTTDADGKVTLKYLKLGHSTLVVQKRAFAEQSKPVTVGWGSNPLDNMDLKPIGTQYSFLLTDWLTGKPVEKAEATSGEFDAVSDKDGKLVLTVDAGKDDAITAKISADTYRTENVNLDPNNKSAQKIGLVSGRKQAFVSKRSGKYDLFKIDVDGKNEELVLKGTGYEQAEIGLVPHPTEELAAMVSTRDNVRNKDGFLLSTLTLVDLTDNSINTVAQSERLQVLGWSGTKLVFAQVIAGTSGGNAKRQRLFAYDYKTQDKKELASSNSFNDLMMIGSAIYFAPSNVYLPAAQTGLIKINADGSSQQTIYDKEVWNLFRSDYSTFELAVGQDWYKYKLGESKPIKETSQPVDLHSRSYTDSPDGKQSLWVEDRDGKGTLLLYDVTTKTDKVLKAQSGLSIPVRWLDSHTLVYRIHNPSETADYVLNTDGGDAKKIRDVTQTDGINRWYYY